MRRFIDVTPLVASKINLLRYFALIQKSIFNVHHPLGLKYICQLRVELSPLKQHKKLHNFDDTPNDWCDCKCAPESTTHFFFHCCFYEHQRVELFNSVIRLIANNPRIDLRDNTKLLLYGHSGLNFFTNKQLLQSTIKYIIDTGRFKSLT